MSIDRFGVVIDFLPDGYMPYYKCFKYLPPGMVERIKKLLGPRAIYSLDNMGWIISIPSFVEHRTASYKMIKSVDALEKILDRLDIRIIHLAKIKNELRRETAEILKKNGRQVLTYSFIKEIIMLLYLIKIIDKCGKGFITQEIGIICHNKTLKRDILHILARYSNYVTSFESNGSQVQGLYSELFKQFGLVVHITQNIESIINKCKIIILDQILEKQYLQGFDQTKIIINLSGKTYQSSDFKGLWINDLFLKMPPNISTGINKDFVGLEDLVWECVLFSDKDFRMIYEAKEIQWEHTIRLIRIINKNSIDVRALQVNDRILAYTGVYRALAAVI
ncbi:MAG: hypothetical protein ACOYEJ_07985 [Mahellales bacterium]